MEALAPPQGEGPAWIREELSHPFRKDVLFRQRGSTAETQPLRVSVWSLVTIQRHREAELALDMNSLRRDNPVDMN